MKFAKKAIVILFYKISKSEEYFFGQHPLVEKLPTATDCYIDIYIKVG